MELWKEDMHTVAEKRIYKCKTIIIFTINPLLVYKHDTQTETKHKFSQ